MNWQCHLQWGTFFSKVLSQFWYYNLYNEWWKTYTYEKRIGVPLVLLWSGVRVRTLPPDDPVPHSVNTLSLYDTRFTGYYTNTLSPSTFHLPVWWTRLLIPLPFQPCSMLYVNTKELYVTCLDPPYPKGVVISAVLYFQCTKWGWRWGRGVGGVLSLTFCDAPCPGGCFEVRWFYVCFQFMLPSECTEGVISSVFLDVTSSMCTGAYSICLPLLLPTCPVSEVGVRAMCEQFEVSYGKWHRLEIVFNLPHRQRG